MEQLLESITIAIAEKQKEKTQIDSEIAALKQKAQDVEKEIAEIQKMGC